MAGTDERSIAGYFETGGGNRAGRRGVYVWRLLGGGIIVLGLALPLLALWQGL